MKSKLAFLLAAMVASASTPGLTKTYFVDYAGGKDLATGLTATAAWKHAPGDVNARDKPAATRLAPGDIVRFKAGVSYRGKIVAADDGALGKPITYSGSGFGNGRAIMDGANPITSITPCPSQSACGGARNWQVLSLVTYQLPTTAFIKLYGPQGMLFEAQSPAPPDAFFGDDIETFAISALAQKASIEAGRLPAPALAKALGGVPSGELLIWVYGNQVVRRRVTGVEGDTLLFQPDGIKLYPDRPGRYALIGSVSIIAAPGQYAVIAPGKAVVWPSATSGLQVGDGRGGIDLNRRRHIVLDGFVFRNYTAANNRYAEGAPVIHTGTPAAPGIVITNNRFEDSALWDGKGVITLSNVSDVTIRNNVFANIERGSGIRVSVNTANIIAENNSFTNIGRTGIAYLGVNGGQIAGNVMTRLRGVHGNGISLYLDNRRINVINNRIDATTRPLTFHGDKSRLAPGNHDFIIERNIFLATPGGQAAVSSWGAETRNVRISNNVMVGPKAGLLLNDEDVGIVVNRNYLSGIVYNDVRPAGWQITNNKTAPVSLLTVPTTSTGIFALCQSTGVARGQTLGGLTC